VESFLEFEEKTQK